MTQDQAPRTDTTDPGPAGEAAVVEWGGEPEPTGRASRLAGLRDDPRLPPLIAGLAGIAVFFSLLGEWRVWTMTGPETGVFTSGLTTFPVVGTGYLVGLFAVAACATLVFYGSAGVRANARLVGLALVGMLGALLVMTTVHLDTLGGTVEDQYSNSQAWSESPPIIEYGRGFYLAVVGVLGIGLALGLARPRRRATAAGEAEPATAAPADTGGWAPEVGGDDWPWRPAAATRRSADQRAADGDDRDGAGPVDLTVQPADPFLPPGDPDRPR